MFISIPAFRPPRARATSPTRSSASTSAVQCVLGLAIAGPWIVALGGCNTVDRTRLPAARIEDRVNTPDVDVDRLDGGETPIVQLPVGDCSDGGTCLLPNAVAACKDGACVVVECEGAFVDCDHVPDNGCEATLTSLEHCGLCGAACRLPHANTDCEQGTCRFKKDDECEPGFGDCDGIEDNGCETSLDTTKNCGACGKACPAVDNGVPACINGECGAGQCLGRFGDCDDDRGDCETELISTSDCGACGVDCAPARGTGACLGGSCVVEACSAGFEDCNGLGPDGCEADLHSAAHCGACGATCKPLRATAASCVQAGSDDRCEVDHSCPKEASKCTEGAPENGCETGYADCDGLGSNGCETALDTPKNCGSCGASCLDPSTIFRCEDGGCVSTGCEIGFDRCPGDAGCRSLAEDAENCGTCGNVCPAAAPNCYGGRCTSATCSPGRADCNNMSACSTDLTDASPVSCGLCDVDCRVLPHAVGACDTGHCAISRCDSGYADCDGVISNGCETDITTPDACGACGRVCALDGASSLCRDGECAIDRCSPGRADCNGSDGDGCETDVSLATSCGTCGLDCTAGAHVVRGGCADGACELACSEGYGDCDGKPDNGCEADFTRETSCGTCAADCTALPHVASAQCGAQGCQSLVCDDGFADCDGIADNGCERSINTATDCGACDRPCAPPRATGRCSAGACEIGRCDSGFADCNSDDADGCEASLASAKNCGSCGTVCEPGRTCDNGMCGCTVDSQCPGNQQCCGGVCADTNAVCSLWPCPIPGTARPSLLHCGGCNVYCPNSAAFFCCGPVGQ